MTEQELMLTSILDCERIDLTVNPVDLSQDQEIQFNQMKDRRALGEPLQYILGQCDFLGIPLSVDKRVHIPRPETEILVDHAKAVMNAMQGQEVKQICDLGTGSGNIAIALAKLVPNSMVTAIDMDIQALSVATDNARNAGVSERLTFGHHDMTQFLKSAAQQNKTYDLIVSNPPYIKTKQIPFLPPDVQQEPRGAFDGGEDGLHYYRTIIQNSTQVIRTGGYIILEIGDYQREDVEQIFSQIPKFHHIQFLKDYVGTDRIVCAQCH